MGRVEVAERTLIVIPCLNEAAVLARVVADLLADDGLQAPLLVVADGGSTDGSVEIAQGIAARDPRVRLLRNPQRLQSAGVNLAVREFGAEATWLIRVDAHAGYPANYASTLIDEARRTGAASVVVTMDTRGKTPFQRAVAAAQNSLLGAGGSAHRCGGRAGWVDHGHHALFRLAAFRAIGGYDETFSHNEDAELDHRLGQAGGKVWLTDRASIVYYPRPTARALARQYFNYGKGRARTVIKHRARLKLRQALPLAVAPAALLALAAPAFWPLALPALAWLAAALGYGLVSSALKRDPDMLAAVAPALIMHLAWSAGFWRGLLHRAARTERQAGAGGGDFLMSPRPLVSVVTANYNGALFLPAAARSIFVQRLADLEWIIADDASSDDSAGVIAGLGARAIHGSSTCQRTATADRRARATGPWRSREVIGSLSSTATTRCFPTGSSVWSGRRRRRRRYHRRQPDAVRGRAGGLGGRLSQGWALAHAARDLVGRVHRQKPDVRPPAGTGLSEAGVQVPRPWRGCGIARRSASARTTISWFGCWRAAPGCCSSPPRSIATVATGPRSRPSCARNTSNKCSRRMRIWALRRLRPMSRPT